MLKESLGNCVVGTVFTRVSLVSSYIIREVYVGIYNTYLARYSFLSDLWYARGIVVGSGQRLTSRI